MIQNLFFILLLLTGFLVGYILSHLCSDEIRAWKKRLIIITIICFILAVSISPIPLISFNYKFPATITLFFIIIVNLTIIWRSY